MQQLFCEYHLCGIPLSTAEEFVTGFCSRHYELLRSDEYFFGVCWRCGEITLIQHKKASKNVLIKDKFIMARGCHKCTGNSHEGLMWMTIRASSPSVSAVTPLGQIVSQKNMSDEDENSIGMLSHINTPRRVSDINKDKSQVIKEELQTKRANPFKT